MLCGTQESIISEKKKKQVPLRKGHLLFIQWTLLLSSIQGHIAYLFEFSQATNQDAHLNWSLFWVVLVLYLLGRCSTT
jgi:hypothetical protein